MQRFRFVAVDATGGIKRGVITAATRADAAACIKKHGLQVREVTVAEEEQVKPSSTASVITRNGEVLTFPDEDPKPDRLSFGGRSNRHVVGSSRLPLFLSAAALLVATAALGVAVFRSPLGRGIGSYDFTSPERAAKSLVQIRKNKDFKAQLELSELEDGRSGEEMARTFEIHRAADFNDLKLLFVSYTKNGKKVRQILSFEKDSETKLWFPKHVSRFDVLKVNEQLAKEMDAWIDKDTD